MTKGIGMTTHKDAEEWLSSIHIGSELWPAAINPWRPEHLLTLLTSYASTRDAEIARLKSIIDGSFRIEEMHMVGGATDARIRCQEALIREFAGIWISWFKDAGAENFVSVTINHKEFGPFELRMRKLFGKSPEMVASEAKQRAERAESENVKLREIVEELAKQLRKIANYETNNESVKGLREWYRAVAKEALRRAQELSKQEGNK